MDLLPIMRDFPKQTREARRMGGAGMEKGGKGVCVLIFKRKKKCDGPKGFP